MKTIILIVIVVLFITYSNSLSWNSIQPSPMETAYCRLASGYDASTGSIWLLGGFQANNGWLSKVMEFNTKTGNFTEHPDMPINDTHFRSQVYCQIRNSIWFIREQVFGVFNMQTQTLQYPYKYNYTDTVTIPLTTYLSPSSSPNPPCLTSYKGRYLIIAGGDNGGGIEQGKQFQIYDIDTNEWIDSLPQLIVSRFAFCCEIVGDYLYAIGGQNPVTANTNTIEMIYLKNISNIKNEQWMLIEDRLSQAKRGHRCSAIGNNIYIVGGYDCCGHHLKTVDRLNTMIGSVIWDSNMIYGRFGVALVKADGFFYAIGGGDFSGSDDVTNAFEYSSKIPTLVPTMNPTVNPTMEPTMEPTIDPTINPTTQLIIESTIYSTFATDGAKNIWLEYENLMIGIATTFAVTICLALLIYFIMCRNKNQFNGEYVKNALVAIIAIGHYDNPDMIQEPDVKDGYLMDLPVDLDVNNINILFGSSLNYNVLPTELKIHWTEQEVVDFLTNDVGNELFDDDENLKYDALVVCVSCHGIQNKIVTSDYRTIEKSVIHRIVSINHPKVREIPRIFVFDSCDGSAKREYIRSSTIAMSQYTVSLEGEENEQKQGQYIVGKGIELVDISTGMEWTENTNNPDYKLAQIHAANKGFQAKCSTIIGSYLIYEFTKAMKNSIAKKQNKTLSTIFEEIQNKLHESGKQQTINTFNNGTGHLRFVKKKK
eukprot:96993_1